MMMYETYEHYKGGAYVKLTEAYDEETEELLVVYIQVVTGKVFCRPKARFEENVVWNGETVPRFRLVSRDMTREEAKKVKFG